jgi:hypothetical protein
MSSARPLAPADIPRLAVFLREAFGAPPSAPFAGEDMLDWKYIGAARVAGDDCSWVMERNGALVAHAGACPVTFRDAGGARVRCTTIIDWAADKAVPGVGIVVYRHVMSRADATFLIGGTEATRQITARMGFRETMRVPVYARWIRPIRELRVRGFGKRALMRALHSVVHPPFVGLAPVRGWRASAVTAFDDSVQAALDGSATLFVAAERTVAHLNHRLACPRTPHLGFLLEGARGARGYAVVALQNWEARIADLRIDSSQGEDWAAAYSAVTRALHREPGVCRVHALAGVPWRQRALEANRYWVNRSEPVSFHDPRGVMQAWPQVDIQYFESDLGYIDN